MPKQELDAPFHFVYSLHHHLVIGTKHRRKVLTSEMLSRFRDLAEERVAAWGGKLIEANGEADHIHMLFTMPPKYALAQFVNALNTGTSRRLRSEFAAELGAVYRKPVLLEPLLLCYLLRRAPLAILKQYIESQERPE